MWSETEKDVFAVCVDGETVNRIGRYEEECMGFVVCLLYFEISFFYIKGTAAGLHIDHFEE